MKQTIKEAQKQRRERIEKIVLAKKQRLLESQEKRDKQRLLVEQQEKEKRIQLLEEKIAILEKTINQIKLDFARYRARNK
jgi:translation initiation factor IF-2